jgi:hypothetical protein
MVLSKGDNMRQLIKLSIVLATLAPTATLAQEDHPWAVRDNLSMAVQDFKDNSPIIADMRTYASPDDMVYAPTGDDDGTDDTSNLELMPIYSLLACMHFTNANSDMTVDSGGGYDITVKDAQFASGSWDADVRIIERAEINELESDKTLVLNKVTVGDITMSSNAQRMETVQMMVATCFSGADAGN